MARYFSTFITGLQEVVQKALKQHLCDIKIELMLDGLVVYLTEQPINVVKDLRFINNTLLAFYVTEKGKKYSPQELIHQVIKKPDTISEIIKTTTQNAESFRVITSDENQLVPINKKLLEDIEALLSHKLRLEVNRSKPDIEVWFLSRREGFGFVGLRITRTPNYEKTLHKGELRPELANIMCLLADLKHQDTVLDPFAGYGSIPVECTKAFKVSKIIAGEKNKNVFKILQDKLSRTKTKVILGRWDALNINSLSGKSVDKIITDPPWGIYDNQAQDLSDFYKNMFTEFARLLKPNGLMVILTSQKDIIENLMKVFPLLELLEEYDILVSGKKAAIYKIRILERRRDE